MSIFSFASRGLKRKLASLFTAVIPILAADPNLAPLIPYVIHAAAALGITGLGHAASTRTLGEHKMATVAAVLAALVELAQHVPALAPYLPILTSLSAFVGALAIGVHTGAK